LQHPARCPIKGKKRSNRCHQLHCRAATTSARQFLEHSVVFTVKCRSQLTMTGTTTMDGFITAEILTKQFVSDCLGPVFTVPNKAGECALLDVLAYDGSDAPDVLQAAKDLIRGGTFQGWFAMNKIRDMPHIVTSFKLRRGRVQTRDRHAARRHCQQCTDRAGRGQGHRDRRRRGQRCVRG